jgi:prepilin-type N-terminal cleavage/methylation domain-containing protein
VSDHAGDQTRDQICDRPRQRSRDAGFTLIEIVVVIIMMALIATVMTGVAATIIHTAGPANTRTSGARTLHGVGTWVAQDAAATAPDDFDLSPSAASGCPSGSPGISLVRMEWSETTGTTIHYVANYRYVDAGGGQFRIERHTCSGPGGGPYPTGVVLKLGGPLSSTPPTVTALLDGSARVIGVSIELFGLDAAPIFVDGVSRNPGESLPPVGP